jgi:hypothetical protein
MSLRELRNSLIGDAKQEMSFRVSHRGVHCTKHESMIGGNVSLLLIVFYRLFNIFFVAGFSYEKNYTLDTLIVSICLKDEGRREIKKKGSGIRIEELCKAHSTL